jgi:flagellar basal-body rod protein FlgB
MIERILFTSEKLSVLKRALDAYADRSKVHARNIANADTPGYRAREIRFEDDLRLALRTGGKGSVERTHERHLGSPGKLPEGRLALRTPSSNWTSNGVNNVEIDREMSDVASNTLRYTVAAELVTRAYEGMRKAIFGRPVG